MAADGRAALSGAGILCVCLSVCLGFTPHKHGSVRLRDGISQDQGRLEVYMLPHRKWGSIFYTSQFGRTEASVVCKQLGYHAGYTSSTSGKHNAWMVDVRCSGEEDELLNCYHRINHGMASSQGYTYIKCVNFRLSGGPHLYMGRVEVLYEGRYGTVCADLFASNDRASGVICNHLGHKGGKVLPRGQIKGGSGDIILDDVSCPEDARMLAECTHRDLRDHNCGHRHDKDVAISCEAATMTELSGPVEAAEGEAVRLECVLGPVSVPFTEHRITWYAGKRKVAQMMNLDVTQPSMDFRFRYVRQLLHYYTDLLTD